MPSNEDLREGREMSRELEQEARRAGRQAFKQGVKITDGPAAFNAYWQGGWREAERFFS